MFCHLCQIFNFSALLKRTAQIGTCPGGSSDLDKTFFASAVLCLESFLPRDFKSEPISCFSLLLQRVCRAEGRSFGGFGLLASWRGASSSAGCSGLQRGAPRVEVEVRSRVQSLSYFRSFRSGWITLEGVHKRPWLLFLILVPTLFSLLFYFICH